MIRKLLLVAAATAMPLGMVAATGSIAGAGTPKVDATNYTLACTGISGEAKFKPALTFTSSGPETVSVKATLSGCTATPTLGGTPVTITSASVKGTLTDPSSTGCTGLLGSTNTAGTLSTKFKTSPKLTDATSDVTVNSVNGGETADSQHGLFGIPGTIPNGAASGPFQGTDGGAGDVTAAATVETVTDLTTACTSSKGLKDVHLTNADSGSVNAVSLG